MNKIRKYICYLLIISSIFILSGCSNDNKDELEKGKLQSEMKYFNTTISDMLNKANGISFQNYQVKAEKIEEQTSNGGNSQNSQSTGTSSEGQSSSGGDSSGQEGNSSNTNGEQNQQDSSKQNNVKYKMVENNILTQDRTPDWDSLTTDVESIYSNWSVVTLDLYKQNMDNQKILSFNTDLDDLTKAIKDKNKTQTLTLLAKLYSYIPTYYAGFSNDQMEINLYKVKSNVFNAYAIIEQNNLAEVKKQLQLAEESMLVMMNNMGNKKQKEYNINKGYILLKDLQNTIDKNDMDIFYLKYKNLMEELNVL